MTLAEVGSAPDIKSFFNLVVSLLENSIKGSKYPRVSEELYSGSLTYDEVYKVKCELDSVNDVFSRFSLHNVYLQSFGMDKNNFRLNLNGNDLHAVFDRLFKAFDEALECTEVYYQGFNEYRPVRVGFTDAPYYIDDVNRALEQYDALGPNDQPFWLR
ncbi:Imm70 family immunity protein [Kosakonia cowanii]|jgi:hypothetical protein|uniref:Imm70 family immunity protein n=1 Tax=Kosakonia cowanii TaxID=208223 RepID=UPI00289448B7|nr:Imm70 family immunity protein [Kosakonia cowanii]MDT3410978.1 hypothetical protein [Atlantibacter sp. SORGH_AS_0304]